VGDVVCRRVVDALAAASAHELDFGRRVVNTDINSLAGICFGLATHAELLEARAVSLAHVVGCEVYKRKISGKTKRVSNGTSLSLIGLSPRAYSGASMPRIRTMSIARQHIAAVSITLAAVGTRQRRRNRRSRHTLGWWRHRWRLNGARWEWVVKGDDGWRYWERVIDGDDGRRLELGRGREGHEDG
jgi:hypothetical protein